MFSVLLHRIGRGRSLATPSAFGPLQHGQSVVGCSAEAKATDMMSVARMIGVRFIESVWNHSQSGRRLPVNRIGDGCHDADVQHHSQPENDAERQLLRL